MVLTRVICLTFLVSGLLSVVTIAHSKVSFLKLSTCQEFDIDSSECQHYFPIDVFKNNISSEYKLHLTFYVMTTNDANIVLTNGKNRGTVRYTAGNWNLDILSIPSAKSLHRWLNWVPMVL